VTLVTTDVSEERSTYIIRVTKIGELGMLAVTSNQHTAKKYYVPTKRIFVTLMVEVLRSS
jgi:hypothetical protein